MVGGRDFLCVVGLRFSGFRGIVRIFSFLKRDFSGRLGKVYC